MASHSIKLNIRRSSYQKRRRKEDEEDVGSYKMKTQMKKC